MKRIRIKQSLKFILDEFIYGGHLISLGAVSVVFTAAILLEIKITWEFLLVVYLETQAVYWYYQFQDIESDFSTNTERCSHIKKYVKKIPYLIVIFILFSIIILLYFNKPFVLSLYLFLFVISIFYNDFFKVLTKKIIGFKNLFAAFIESFLIILLIVYYSFPLNLSVFLLLIFVYLRWLANTAFLDIKDIESDKKRNLLTFAILLKKRLIGLLKVVSLLSMLPIFFGVFWGIFPSFSLMLFLIVPYTFYYLSISKRWGNNIYYVFADGEFMLWSLFIVLGLLISKI